MLEINNIRYYSIDEFPNYIKLKGKSLTPSTRLQLIEELINKSNSTFYADGIVNAIVTPHGHSIFSQLEKQISISGMISIHLKFLSQSEHDYIELNIKDGLINGRPYNFKERILITNPWQFYSILQNRNFNFFKGLHYSRLKENIISRLKGGRTKDLPDIDLFFDTQTITNYCNEKGLSINLDQIHLQEQIISERAKEITDKWSKKPIVKPINKHNQLSPLESSFVLSLEKFLKSNRRSYNSKFIQIGIAVIHLVDDLDFDDNHEYALAIRDIAIRLRDWVEAEEITLYDQSNHFPVGLNELRKTYDNVTVTKPDGFNILLSKLVSIDQLIKALSDEKFEQSKIDFFTGLKNGKFPDPINHFKTQVINVLLDLPQIYKKINFPIPIVANSIKQYFEAHPLINDFPTFKEFYFWLETNYQINPKIKKANPREVIFDDGDERTKTQIGKNFKSIINKIKQKLAL